MPQQDSRGTDSTFFGLIFGFYYCKMNTNTGMPVEQDIVMQVTEDDQGASEVGRYMIPDAYMEQSAVQGLGNITDNVVDPALTAVSPFAQPTGQSVVLGQAIENGYVVVDPALSEATQLPQHTGQPETTQEVSNFEFVNYP